MPRFVILEHDWPTLHWDLLLEDGEELRSWRLLAEPALGLEVPIEVSFLHRKLYLDYEGPVSGGRGSVSRWDTGMFSWIERADDNLVLEMRGTRLCCRCTLNVTKGRAQFEESTDRTLRTRDKN